MKVVKRLFLILLAYSYVFVPNLRAKDGMSQQNQHLISAVTAFLRLRKKQRQRYLRQKYNIKNMPSSLKTILVLILEKEARCFGPNIGVNCSIESSFSGKLYKMSIFNKVSKAIICSINVKLSKRGAFNSHGRVNPNSDGCLQCSVTGKLCVCKPLESVFVMCGKNVKEGSSRDFSNGGNKNVYKVREVPCVRQKRSGPCGYYSLFNLLCMFENSRKMKSSHCDYGFMLDRKRFESFFSEWEQNVKNMRGWFSSTDALSNREMKRLIESGAKSLHKKNVMISFCDINNLDNRKANTFAYGSIKGRIKDFRTKGTPQYIIFSSSSSKNVKGINLCWDDRRGRKACLGNHWIAMKIEWAGREQKSPVIISVADSGMTRDNRYAAMIHWYYQTFVQSRV